MIRLTVILGIGLFVTLLIAGQDHGQLRYGLMLAKQEAAAAAVVAPVQEVAAEAFVPVKPVMTATLVSAEPTAEVTASDPVVTPDVVADTSIADDIWYVAGKSANMRSGPGKEFDVIDTVPQGEAVMVVLDENGVEGWSHVRFEGDGVEGYIASRLLSQDAGSVD